MNKPQMIYREMVNLYRSYEIIERAYNKFPKPAEGQKDGQNSPSRKLRHILYRYDTEFATLARAHFAAIREDVSRLRLKAAA